MSKFLIPVDDEFLAEASKSLVMAMLSMYEELSVEDKSALENVAILQDELRKNAPFHEDEICDLLRDCRYEIEPSSGDD